MANNLNLGKLIGPSIPSMTPTPLMPSVKPFVSQKTTTNNLNLGKLTGGPVQPSLSPVITPKPSQQQSLEINKPVSPTKSLYITKDKVKSILDGLQSNDQRAEALNTLSQKYIIEGFNDTPGQGVKVIGDKVNTPPEKNLLQKVLTPAGRFYSGIADLGQGISETIDTGLTKLGVISDQTEKNKAMRTLDEGIRQEILGKKAGYEDTAQEVGRFVGSMAVTPPVSRGLQGAKLIPRMLGGATEGLLGGASYNVSTGEGVGSPISLSVPTAIGGALPLVGPIYRGVSNYLPKVVRGIIGKTTGTSASTIGQVYKSAVEGSDEAIKGLRGDILDTDILNSVEKGVDAVKGNRKQLYGEGYTKLVNNKNIIDIKDIALETLQGMYDDLGVTFDKKLNLDFSQSKVTSKGAQQNLIDIVDDLKNWRDKTPAGLDILKQRISDYARYTPEYAKSDRFATMLSNKIKDKITDVVPEYADMMKNYSELTDLLKDIQSALSVGGKARKNVAITKLKGIFRDNQEFRQAMITEIEKYSGKDIGGQIAGLQMSPLLPKGLAGVGVGIGATAGLYGAIAGTLSNPLTAIPLLLTSPRVVGEIANFLGVSVNKLNKYTNFIKSQFRNASIPTAVNGTINRVYTGMPKGNVGGGVKQPLVPKGTPPTLGGLSKPLPNNTGVLETSKANVKQPTPKLPLVQSTKTLPKLPVDKKTPLKQASKSVVDNTLLTEARKYKTADEFVEGDRTTLLGQDVIIDDIYRGNIQIDILDGKKKNIFIPDNEATVTIMNNEGKKREIPFDKFKEIIEQEHQKSILASETKKIKAIEREKRKIVNDEIKSEYAKKSSGLEYKVGKDNVEKLKETDFFVYKDLKYITDKVSKYDDEVVYDFVLVREPKKSYQFNKENFTQRVTKSQLRKIRDQTPTPAVGKPLPKVDNTLLSEARKYKSADEFVEKHYKKSDIERFKKNKDYFDNEYRNSGDKEDLAKKEYWEKKIDLFEKGEPLRNVSVKIGNRQFSIETEINKEKIVSNAKNKYKEITDEYPAFEPVTVLSDIENDLSYKTKSQLRKIREQSQTGKTTPTRLPALPKK